MLGAGLVAERTPPERVRLAHVHPHVLQELFGRLHDGLERAGKGCEKMRRGRFKITVDYSLGYQVVKQVL